MIYIEDHTGILTGIGTTIEMIGMNSPAPDLVQVIALCLVLVFALDLDMVLVLIPGSVLGLTLAGDMVQDPDMVPAPDHFAPTDKIKENIFLQFNEK